MDHSVVNDNIALGVTNDKVEGGVVFSFDGGDKVTVPNQALEVVSGV